MRAAVCGRALSWRSITPDVSIPRLFFQMDLRSSFRVLHYTSDAIVVPCCMNFTISTPFLSQKTVAISFLADVCLNFFGLFGELCASTALTTLWFQHSQMKPRLHHLLLVRCDWEINRHLCGIALRKTKPKPFSAFCAHPWAFWEAISREICGNSHGSSEIMERHLSQIFWSILWRSSLTTDGGHFALLREHLFAHLWTFYTIGAMHYSRWISAAVNVFSVKKADKSANFAAGGIIKLRTHISLHRDKNKH
jgi:hypothetical protein